MNLDEGLFVTKGVDFADVCLLLNQSVRIAVASDNEIIELRLP